MLHMCFAAGLRVSELVGLPLTAVRLQPTPILHIQGKGRRHRALPLWKQTAEDVRAGLAVRGEALVPELFVSAQGRAMTRVGFAYILRKYVQRAAKDCCSLAGKHVSPHVLRHSCAMMIYQATGDLRKVALWLGHAHMQTTEVYLRADPTEKLNAIEAVIPPSLRSVHGARSIDRDFTWSIVMKSTRSREARAYRLRSPATFHNLGASIREFMESFP
jgi:integrase/recombinase XerD